MSRLTRSQQVVSDENAVPPPTQQQQQQQQGGGMFRFTKRGSGMGGGAAGVRPAPPPPGVVPTKPTLNVRKSSGRSVLSDISNQIQKTKDEQLAKKKRVVEEAEKGDNAQQHYVEVIEEEPEDNEEAPIARAPADRPVERPPQQGEKLAPEVFEEDAKADVDMGHEDEKSLEDSVADLKLDVDAGDLNNPQCCHEYIQDIMAYLFESEQRKMPSPTYMSKQTDINTKMREILLDWLVEVHLKFKLKAETLYLTVNLIDRFLEKRAVMRTKLQLVGCTAMLIAAKYEEIYAPEVKDFVTISDSAYTKEQILAMESIMLNSLGFHVTVPTALRFGERLCKVARVHTEAEFLIRYLMELTLQDYRFLRFRPSEIAAAAAYIGMKTTGYAWDATMEHHCGYTREKLNEVILELHQLAVRDPPKYKAVRKKYLHTKLHEVSKIPICEL